MSRVHRTAPDPEEKGWPGGVPYIIGNEACERFSFYGMKSLLIPYLTTLYMNVGLAEDVAGKNAATAVHVFVAGVYALPMIGAILADKLLGKYLTIMSLSLFYCLGHGVLAIWGDTLPGMQAGLALIAIGAGGIKPCVSAHVGDQFGKANWHLTKKVFQYFYLSINGGSFVAKLIMPWLLVTYGFEVAFGLPGVLMFVATIVFWWGRHKFIHVPPQPGGKVGLLDFIAGTLLFVGALAGWMFGPQIGLGWTEIFVLSVISLGAGLAAFAYRQKLEPDDGFIAVLLTVLVRGKTQARERLGEEAYDGMLAVFRVLSVIVFVTMFWTLFDQKDTTWVLQAKQMDLQFDLPLIGEFSMLHTQQQSWNAGFVLILIPIFSFVIFPFFEKRGIRVTPLKRMVAGMFLAPLSFVVVALIQTRLDAGESVHITWQLIPFCLITASEILVSATGLEFAYSQAPKRMKSSLMGFWLLTTSFGNLLAAGTINRLRDRPILDLFWLCAGLMVVVAVLFAVRTKFYRYRDYPQG